MILRDDDVESISCSFCEDNLVRVGCIGDGSCFFHAIMKGFHGPYQENNNYSARKSVARRFRESLADDLTETIYNSTPLQDYSTNNVEMVGSNHDFSINGIRKLFRSRDYVGQEVFELVGIMIGINIYGLSLVDGKLFPFFIPKVKRDYSCVIVVMVNEIHYELIARRVDDGYQTLFDKDDSLIKKIDN